MHSHNDQQQILAEVHAGPLQALPAPLSLLHIAVLLDGLDGAEVEGEVLAIVVAGLGEFK